MNINVSFRHVEPSDILRDTAVSKLEHICKKYVSGKTSATVTFVVEKHLHTANIVLSISNLTLRASKSSDNMYKSLEKSLESIENQLHRHKDRIHDYKPSASESREARMLKMGVLANEQGKEDDFVDEDEDFAEDYELYPLEEETASASTEEKPQEKRESDDVIQTSSGPVKLLKQGGYEAKTLSVKEAVLQLDLLEDREFYLFNDIDSNDICVVYKRKDGNIGIISTGHK